MALAEFNQSFLPNLSVDEFRGKGQLPEDPGNFVQDRYMQEAIDGYQRSNLYEYFEIGLLGTRIKIGEYNKGDNINPRYVQQAKVTTTQPAFFQLLQSIRPELAENAKCYGIRSDSRQNQYVMTVSGNNPEVNKLIGQCEYAQRIINQMAFDETPPDEGYWALLSGIVAGGRGCFRIVNQTQDHDPDGDIRVQFDFKKGDVLETLLNKAVESTDFWERTDKDESTRLELRGVNAFNFITKLHSACPILAYTNPEIVLMIVYGVDEKIDRNSLYQAYCEIKGIKNQI